MIDTKSGKQVYGCVKQFKGPKMFQWLSKCNLLRMAQKSCVATDHAGRSSYCRLAVQYCLTVSEAFFRLASGSHEASSTE